MKDLVKCQGLVVHKAVVHKVHEVGTEADVKISEHIIDVHKVPDCKIMIYALMALLGDAFALKRVIPFHASGGNAIGSTTIR